MLEIKKLTLNGPCYPESLRQIPAAPKVLFWKGTGFEYIATRPRVAIVGSRNVSPYGREVTLTLARQLSEQGVVIISGLAFGVDALAHTATLDAEGTTIAVLPGPLEQIRPAGHTWLAQRIIAKGGAMVSEYPDGTPALRQHFVARNRIVAGLSDAIVITEAAEKSGSLHTARYALEQGKDVLAVPGPITSPTSVGVNNLIKAGATPVTTYRDVLYALGREVPELHPQTVTGDTPDEQHIIDLLRGGLSDGTALLAASGLMIAEFNQIVTMLEVAGKIRPLGGNQWAIY